MPTTLSNPFSSTRIRSRTRSSGRGGFFPHEQEVHDFSHGLINFISPQAIPRGAAVDSLNFLTMGSKIEIKHGYSIAAGSVRQTGSTSGVIVFTAHKWDGTDVLFKAQNQSLFFFDDSLAVPDFTEIGTNILNGAAGEDVWFAEYHSPAGSQLWVSSPNSTLIKIMVANPASYTVMYLSGTNFYGKIKITQNRMWCWAYGNVGAITNIKGRKANNAVQLSYVDTQAYTTVATENLGSGDGTTKTFTGTLAFRAAGATRTCFGITVTDGTETFTDNFLGTLTGSLGGTGTINYTTGAISVTFNTAPGVGVNNITDAYQWENSNSTGISDFTRAATRLIGTGASFLQAEGGQILNILTYDTVEYCIHERATWKITIAADDTAATNLVFRKNVSMLSSKGAVATADGIFLIDVTIKSKFYFGLIHYSPESNTVEPENISQNKIDLTNFRFDNAVMIEWDRYIICACRTLDSTKNNRLILYNKIFKCFDVVDFFANSLTIKNGVLTAGDSSTNNVHQLFSGFDDDGSIPYAYWIGNIDKYGIQDLKTTRELRIEGEIDKTQSCDVLISIDRGLFTKIGTIAGSGAYVDSGNSYVVGQYIVGQSIVGGGNIGLVSTNHYLTNLKIRQGRFQNIQIKFQTTGIGYFSVSSINHYDIKVKQNKLPTQYRQ